MQININLLKANHIKYMIRNINYSDLIYPHKHLGDLNSDFLISNASIH